MKYLLAILLISCFVVDSVGQADDQIVPSEIKYRSIVNEPLTLKKGFLRVGMTASLVTINEIFDENGEKLSISENAWVKGLSTDFLAQYGISDRLQAEIFIPVLFQEISGSYLDEYPASSKSEQVMTSRPTKGLGDISLAANYQVLKEDASGSGMIFSAIATLPTGEKNRSEFDGNSFAEATGSGELQIMGELKYRKVFYPYSIDGFLRYKHSFGGTKVVDSRGEPINFQGGPLFSASANFSLMLNDWIAFKNGISYTILNADTEAGEEVEFSNASELAYFPFISFQFKKFRIEEAVLFPILGKNTSADKSFFLIVRYIF